MRSHAKPVTWRQWRAADHVGVAEGLFEDELTFVDNCNHATGLLGLAHLVFEPLRDVVEGGLQPVVHVPFTDLRKRESGRSGDPFTPPGAPLAIDQAPIAGARSRQSGYSANFRGESSEPWPSVDGLLPQRLRDGPVARLRVRGCNKEGRSCGFLLSL